MESSIDDEPVLIKHIHLLQILYNKLWNKKKIFTHAWGGDSESNKVFKFQKKTLRIISGVNIIRYVDKYFKIIIY
jgi:hypothetical protein